jgi:hypothetical protein
MGAVSYVTELGNVITPTDVVSGSLGPALVKKVTMMNLMHLEDLPPNTNVKKLRKDAALTAVSGATTESTAVALASGGELTQTSVTATAAKMAISSALSVEEQQWGTVTAAGMAEKQADAIARGVDNEALGLAAGFSNSVTASAGATLEDIYLCQYTIFAGEVPDKEIPLAVVITHKANYNLKIQSMQTGASAFVNQQFLGILNSTPQANNFAGAIPGFNFYATSGFGTSGGDTVQLVIHPKYALFGMFAPRPVTWFVNKGTEGLYSETVTYFFYDVGEYYDAAGVGYLSDT